MTLQNYKTANNATSQIATTLSAGATSLVCTTWQGGRFPSIFPFYLTLEKIVADVVTKREIVKVTNRSGDTFTIVRSAGYCLADATATAQTNTAFAFDVYDFIALRFVWEVLTDINDELVRIESDKLNVADYQNGTKVYWATSTWTDAYAITLSPVPASYITWMSFKFLSDVGNTWAATLNVNSLWAKTIKKLRDQDLVSGDIEAWQIVTVSYDGTNFQMDSQVATIPTIDIAGQTATTPAGDDSIILYDASAGANRKATISVLNTASPFTWNSDYPAWETLSAWNVVFIEWQPTTAEADSVANIGDVSANTRISFPVFGSGSSASTLKLNLAKTWSPGVNLNIRIETDNAWAPSGTLVHANATGTVTAWSLTTSLVDTTVTLGGAFTITAWQKCHIVTFAWTYGAETVNGSNYYNIGISGVSSTTTRFWEKWSGSAWSDILNGNILTEATADTLVFSSGTTTAYWYRILANNECALNSVTKNASVNATRCRVFPAGGGTVIWTASFSGNVATFSGVTLLKWLSYAIELDSSGASYNSYTDNTFTAVNRKNISYSGGSYNSGATLDTIGYNIASIETSAVFNPYTSSTLFATRLLSKTDADLSYKIDWFGITQEAVTTWDLTAGKYPVIALAWVDSNQTGMTQGTIMYLSNTAWSISSTAGTYRKIIWEAKTTTKLQIFQSDIASALSFTRDISNTSATVTYAHNLWKIPNSIDISGIYADGETRWVATSTSNQFCIARDGTTVYSWSSIARITTTSGATSQTGVLSNITKTTFDIVWTKVWSPWSKICSFIALVS